MKPHIAIVVGTTRATRFSEKPARWVHGIAAARDDLTAELVDLRDYPMPFFEEVATNAFAPSKNEMAQRWQRKIAGFDGYVFVTAEYNHGIPAVLKNALDYAYVEWVRKAAAFVGYGGVGAARSIEHLRGVCIELQMAPLRHGVTIQGAEFRSLSREGKEFGAFPQLEAGAQAMFDHLVWWTSALKTARDAAASAA